MNEMNENTIQQLLCIQNTMLSTANDKPILPLERRIKIMFLRQLLVLVGTQYFFLVKKRVWSTYLNI